MDIRWYRDDELFMVLRGKTLMPASDGVINSTLAAVYSTQELARNAADRIAEMAGATLPKDRAPK